MLGGTELIRRKLGKDAYAMTVTLRTDSQGKKMGKTAGNAVWLDPNKTSPCLLYTSIPFWILWQTAVPPHLRLQQSWPYRIGQSRNCLLYTSRCV